MSRITDRRVNNLIDELVPLRYRDPVALQARCVVDHEPIPQAALASARFTPLEVGTRWGSLWDSAWFTFDGLIPPSYAGHEVVALIDIGSEGCLFTDGVPCCGLTYKREGNRFERKRRIMLESCASGGEAVHLLVEGAANGLFGEHATTGMDWPYFTLNQAAIAIFDRKAWQVCLDIEFLLQLYESLDPSEPRARKILQALDTVADLTDVASHLDEALQITAAVLAKPAHASALTAFSVGHAHLDLGWLWPYRETRRKSARTIATALRMIEEYPSYRFGISQPQQLEWLKKDYPALFGQVKQRIADGSIECQGGHWVECDMNLIGNESIVRQFLYGKRFYRDEFGIEVDHVWLPDAFGFPASLPQVMAGCGLRWFVTQKISWNETNQFPHHTFLWKGIDGTVVNAHFLPTNDYNLTNEPAVLRAAERRFAQGGIQDAFLNLYGIGDGGGGPSRRHIEWALRAADCEGLPHVRLATAREFFGHLEQVGCSGLPEWRGELYLELHRGTYTVQSRMKRYNRLLEHALHDVEFLGATAMLAEGATYPKQEMERIWKETLLNQFHDVLPGSSIAQVYRDAHAMSEHNLKRLEELKGSWCHDSGSSSIGRSIVNTLSWNRRAVLQLDEHWFVVDMPGFSSVMLGEHHRLRDDMLGPGQRVSYDPVAQVLQNSLVWVQLADDGTIAHLKLKETDSDLFGSEGGNRFLLYEDKPYAWDAWDISGYYRQTKPEQARLLERSVCTSSPVQVQIEQTFAIGASRIVQTISLEAWCATVRMDCHVQWAENHKMLKVSAEPACEPPTATYGIQFGTVERPVSRNTAWEEAKFETCAHQFATIGDGRHGLALLDDCKYGHRIQDGVMELTLLRSPLNPDPSADRGGQDFAYAYHAYRGTWREAALQRVSDCFNNPLLVVEGSLKGLEQPLFAIDDDSIKIETVKPAEDGSGIIVRLWETTGSRTAATLTASHAFTQVWETDLLECPVTKLAQADRTVRLEFGPYGIRTLLCICS